jgi:hypothetical protein
MVFWTVGFLLHLDAPSEEQAFARDYRFLMRI